MRIRTLSVLALAAASTAVLPAGPTAAQPSAGPAASPRAEGAAPAARAPRYTDRRVTVRVRGTQKTTWQAAPVADPGCQNKAGGFRGSGTETIEWSHARTLRGRLTGSGGNWGLTVEDRNGNIRSTLPISGTVDRRGSGVSVVCGEDRPDTSAPCTGRATFNAEGLIQFLTRRRLAISDPTNVSTSSLYPQCEWPWDGMTVRTGNVLLNVGKGRFDPRRLANSRTSITLRGSDEQRCEDAGSADGVQCVTVTDWRVTLYPARRSRR